MDHNFESHLLGTTEQNRALQPVGFSPFSTGKKGLKNPFELGTEIPLLRAEGEKGRRGGRREELAG